MGGNEAAVDAKIMVDYDVVRWIYVSFDLGAARMP
jgi:hypothetical protein